MELFGCSIHVPDCFFWHLQCSLMHKSCFSLRARKSVMSATFLPILGYGDVVYMSASTSCLQSLTPVYHCALRFITGCSRLTHHCELYAKAGMPSLNMRRWMTVIYKALLGLVSTYLCTFLQRTGSRCALRSNDILHFSIPRVRTETGKKVSQFLCPLCWECPPIWTENDILLAWQARPTSERCRVWHCSIGSVGGINGCLSSSLCTQ